MDQERPENEEMLSNEGSLPAELAASTVSCSSMEPLLFLMVGCKLYLTKGFDAGSAGTGASLFNHWPTRRIVGLALGSGWQHHKPS